MPLRQSFCWWTFAGRGVSDRELLQKAKAIGYDAVELLSSPQQMEGALALGYVIVSHGGHQSIDRGWNDLSEHPRLETELHESLILARKYRIPNLIVFSGNRRVGLTDEEGLDNTAQGLARIAPAAEDAGVTLILELLNSKRDHPRYQCDRTAWGVEVCRRVASPRVRLLYDIYHMQVMEGDLISTIGAYHTDFGHYHTAGCPGRQDLDSAQEIAYSPVFKAIAGTGYDGYLGHEFLPKGDPLAALQDAYELCRRSLTDGGNTDAPALHS